MFPLHALPLHNTLQTSTNQKKDQTDNLIGTKFRVTSKHHPLFAPQTTRACSQTLGLIRPPNFSPPKEEMTGEESLYCYSFTLPKSGFQAPSSASLSSLLYPPNHWIKIPSGLHAVAVLMGHARDGKRTSVSCTCQGKHGEHHRGTTHGTLAHRIAEGMHTGQSGLIGPIINGLEQTAAGSLRKLHGERCETRIPPKC